MQILPNNHYLNTHILHDCVQLALKSTCHRSKCGSLIVANPSWFTALSPELKENKCVFHDNTTVIGRGYNSMPCNVTGACVKDELPATFKSDRTCCVHAEQRAIMAAIAHAPKLVEGSVLFFIRLNDQNQPTAAGAPYCSICSKMALDAGLSYFCLYNGTNWVAYNTFEYNTLTFQYK